MTTASLHYLQRPTTRDKRTDPPRAYGRYAIAIRLRDVVVASVRSAAEGRRVRLVDVGCGDRPYADLIKDHLSSYTGIDLPGNAEAAYHILPDGRTTAPDAIADLVLSTQVLEHVRDVELYLAECRRILADGGRLVITTHGAWVYHPDPNDYWRWTPQGLREVLARAGFEVVEMRGILGLMAMGIQTFQDGFVRKLPKRLRSLACLLLQQLVLVADRFHTDADRLKDAAVFAIVARKVNS